MLEFRARQRPPDEGNACLGVAERTILRFDTSSEISVEPCPFEATLDHKQDITCYQYLLGVH